MDTTDPHAPEVPPRRGGRQSPDDSRATGRLGAPGPRCAGALTVEAPPASAAVTLFSLQVHPW
jgi:hypothetical protein